MGSSNQGLPRLDGDQIVHFRDADHFLVELTRNLRKGRIFVSSAEPREADARFSVQISGPGVDWKVGAEVVVVSAYDSQLELQLQDYKSEVSPTLELLSDEVKALKRTRRRETKRAAAKRSTLGANTIGPEPTVVGPAPELPPATPSRSRRVPRRKPKQSSSAQRKRPTRRRATPEKATPKPSLVPDDLISDLGFDSKRPPIPAPRRVSELAELDAVKAPSRPSRASAASTSTPPATDVREAPVPADLDATAAPQSVPRTADLQDDTGDRSVTRATQVASLGIENDAEALEELPLPRFTGRNILRMRDPSNLLGVYLSQIRHGHLTVYGATEHPVGEEISFKVACGRVETLQATVVARVGEWTTLEIDDDTPVRALLESSHADWSEALAELASPAAEVVEAQAEDDEPSLVPEAPEPDSDDDAPSSADEPDADAPTPDQEDADEQAASPEPEPAAAEEPEISRDPEPPTLDGKVVNFSHMIDLRHEVDTNLKNGGLSVRSDPLDIREHFTLNIHVNGEPIGVDLEADVVFAGGGLVGFSVQGFSGAVAQLEEAMASRASAPAAEPEAAPEETDDEASSTPQPATIKGRISKPPSLTELLDFPTHAIEDLKPDDRVSVLALIDYIARSKSTGTLMLRLQEETLILYLHEGGVVFVRSEPGDPDQRLGRLLVAAKRLTEPAVREGVERARRKRRPLGQSLVAMGHLKAPLLSQTLREQCRMRLEPAFSWSAGSWELGPWKEPPTNADLVLTNGSGVVSRHVRNRYDMVTQSEIEALFGPNLGGTVIRAPGSDGRTRGMGMTQKELRFIEVTLDGSRTLTEAVTGSPLGRLASLRLVALGLSMRVLVFKAGTRVARGRAQTRRPTDVRGFDALKKSISEHLRLMRNQNHFEILGVHWSASHRSYGAARDTMRAEFDLSSAPLCNAPDDVKKLAKEALSMIEKAFEVLDTPKTRIAYRKKLFDSTERQYSADMLIKQGEVLILRGDRVGGIEALETAYELSPTNRNRRLLEAARDDTPI